jgi:hypothetical protein
MAARTRRWVLPILIFLASALTLACDPIGAGYFLFGPEPRTDPEIAIAPKESSRKVRVVVLTHGGLETRPELSGADRELNRKLCHHLIEGYKHNEEHVAVVPPAKVEQFKADTPNWRTLDFRNDIGKHFDADYVIFLEIETLSLYQTGSGNTLFHGKALVHASVINVYDPDGDVTSKPFTCDFPSESRGDIAVGDMTIGQFREQFLDYAAKRLSWLFVAHPIEDGYKCD